mmetsp:Transcript_111036/g.220883  ORF Transcript_111036/g.220883 Transcript_111036/m.220883 type:complete len:213 (-) Transcript_111036:138-776(-)
MVALGLTTSHVPTEGRLAKLVSPNTFGAAAFGSRGIYHVPTDGRQGKLFGTTLASTCAAGCSTSSGAFSSAFFSFGIPETKCALCSSLCDKNAAGSSGRSRRTACMASEIRTSKWCVSKYALAAATLPGLLCLSCVFFSDSDSSRFADFSDLSESAKETLALKSISALSVFTWYMFSPSAASPSRHTVHEPTRLRMSTLPYLRLPAAAFGNL